MPRDPRRESLLPDGANPHARPHARLIISLNTAEEFRDFVADEGQANRLFEALLWVRNEHEEGVEMYNQLLGEKAAVDEENKRLLQEIEDQKARALRMEGALTYVEDQMTELRANQNAHLRPPLPAGNPPPPPGDSQQGSPPPGTPSDATTTGGSKKIVVVPDPPIFEGKIEGKDVSYDHWLLQRRNKMTANETMMPTDTLKKAYVQSRVSGNALAQLEPRLREDTTRPFTTANEMFETLTPAFGDPSRKQSARGKYRTLRQGDRNFNDFWAEFQRLAAELDHSEETLIDDLVEKCHYTIQQQLATGEEDPTSLTQLAKRCQRIELSLKKAGRNQLAHERYAARKPGPTATKASAAPAATPTTSATPASSRFARISQPRIQEATTTPSPSTTPPRLTEDERAKLMKFGRCFNCKREGHMLPDCTQPFRPFSAVSTLLQEVALVEESENE